MILNLNFVDFLHIAYGVSDKVSLILVFLSILNHAFNITQGFCFGLLRKVILPKYELILALFFKNRQKKIKFISRPIFETLIYRLTYLMAWLTSCICSSERLSDFSKGLDCKFCKYRCISSKCNIYVNFEFQSWVPKTIHRYWKRWKSISYSCLSHRDPIDDLWYLRTKIRGKVCWNCAINLIWW